MTQLPIDYSNEHDAVPPARGPQNTLQAPGTVAAQRSATESIGAGSSIPICNFYY